MSRRPPRPSSGATFVPLPTNKIKKAAISSRPLFLIPTLRRKHSRAEIPAPHGLVPWPAVSPMPTMAAAIAAPVMTAAPATSTASWTSASTSAPRAPIRAIPSRPCSLWGSVAIEVWLALFFLEITATFDGHGSSRSGSPFTASTTHLGALLLQDRLARQPDPVAFHRKHLYEYLVA